MFEAPAMTKDAAIALPIPRLPPVMKTVLLAAEMDGLVGEIAGYVVVCHVGVYFAAISLIVIGCWYISATEERAQADAK